MFPPEPATEEGEKFGDRGCLGGAWMPKRVPLCSLASSCTVEGESENKASGARCLEPGAQSGPPLPSVPIWQLPVVSRETGPRAL